MTMTPIRRGDPRSADHRRLPGAAARVGVGDRGIRALCDHDLSKAVRTNREQVTAHVRDQVDAGPESGPESLELHVLALLIEEPLPKSAIADGLGHQSVSAGLRVIRNLVRDTLIAYTVRDRPDSRVQRYRITPAGRSALEESAKSAPRPTPRTTSFSKPPPPIWRGTPGSQMAVPI